VEQERERKRRKKNMFVVSDLKEEILILKIY
jgi:hypothetical protein